MRAPKTFQVMAIDFPGSRPTFRAAQYDHRPTRPECFSRCTRLLLDLANLKDALLQGGGHCLMHARPIAPFDEVWGVTVTNKQGLQLVVADASQESRVIDLVTVEVEDGQ